MKLLNSRIALLFTLVGLLLLACADNSKKLELKASTVQIWFTKNVNATKRLPVLWIEKDSIDKLGNVNLYFTYVLDASDNSLTLHGWPTKMKFWGGLDFDTLDADILRLNKSGTSSIEFDNSIYLSPLYLDKKKVKAIKNVPSENKYVIFTPRLYRKNGYGSIIKYTYEFSSEKPSPASSATGDSTQVLSTMMFMIMDDRVANPSPPKYDY